MPDENEDTGFVVRDRRRFLSDTPAASEPPAAPPPPPTPIPLSAMESVGGESAFPESEEDEYEIGFGDEEGEGEAPELPDVYSMLALFLGELQSLAVVRLGLAPNPMNGEPAPDLPQARIAIDTIGFLAGQLDAVVSPDEKLPLKAMVSDLQMAFVEQSRRAAGGAE